MRHHPELCIQNLDTIQSRRYKQRNEIVREIIERNNL